MGNEISKKKDKSKNVNELIKENITCEPKNEQELIENQILLDQIIYEKYKGKEIIIYDDSKIKLIEERYPNFVKYKSKIYSDESINVNSHYLLNYYYSKKSAASFKLKFSFYFNKGLLNEANIRMISEEIIIPSIEKLARIPKKKIHITNIREEYDIISFDLFLSEFLSPTLVEDIFCEKNISVLKNNLNDNLKYSSEKFKIGSCKIKNIEIRNIISNYFISPIILKPILYPNTNNFPKTNFTIINKIDKNKNLKELIYEYITPESFKNPKNEATFIENRILLDQIIYEKYKDKQINFDDNIYRNNSEMEALLLYFENKKYNVYVDNSIDQDLYKEINKYYFNDISVGKKIRLSLGINGSIIKDKDKLRDKIINPIISAIGKLTKIPKENVFVTNVRNNCLVCDIYFYGFPIIKEIIHNLFRKNQKQIVTEIHQCLNEIDDVLENDPDLLYSKMENKAEIHDEIHNYVIREGFYFDRNFDKPIGSFGLHSFWIFEWHVPYKMENDRQYFYPGQQWDGFGLIIRDFDRREIFDPNGGWCTAFLDLTKKQKRYNIRDVIKETLYDRNNRRYSLILQCRIKRDQIFSDDNGKNIVMLNDKYVVPYRLLRENIAD